MSFAQSLRPRLVRLSGLAGILGLPLLAGCAYQDGYYDPSPGYGYDYGYGGYGYGGYGYGGYGYGGYGYGSPCWPYGCNDWHRHHRHHHWDGDDDNDDSHQHRRGAGMGMGGSSRFDPGKPQGQPHYVVPPSANNDAPKQPRSGRPSTTPYVWVPQQKDSKN